MPSNSAVPRYLAQANYRYQDKSRLDIENALEQYRCLYPDLEKYVFSTGQERELLALKGTIPVRYKGNMYNIPICIYLTDNHPYSPPLCYVRPTPEMKIKESKHVDSSGFIYLPYLSDWKSDTSDLLGVIQVMIIIFSETPPVYQKPKNQPLQQYNQTPYPINSGFPMPKPGGQPNPYPTPNQYGASNNQYPFSHQYQPLPSSQPYPNPSNSGSPYPPSTYPSYQVNTNMTPFSNPSDTSPVGGSGTITEEHIRASLLSAVEDKVKERLRERLGKAHAELDVLKKTAEELNRGRDKLDDIMNKMEKEMAELETTKKQLKSANDKLDEILAKHENKDDKVEIDEAFGPSQPLYKQLMNLFAKENAIVDAIYYLGEALRKDVIDLEIFLKHIRSLSREQFMLRALMQKCRDKAGLPY